MLKGETVTVFAPRLVGSDEYGADVYEFDPIEVENVLVAPAHSMDLTGSMRPTGDATDLVLYFPKSFTGSLRSARVRVREQTYEVQGDPLGFDPAITPTSWNLVVGVKRVDG